MLGDVCAYVVSGTVWNTCGIVYLPSLQCAVLAAKEGLSARILPVFAYKRIGVERQIGGPSVHGDVADAVLWQNGTDVSRLTLLSVTLLVPRPHPVNARETSVPDVPLQIFAIPSSWHQRNSLSDT